jgi:hypothetical protein
VAHARAHTRKQRVRVGRDQVFEQDKLGAVFFDRNQARHERRHFDACETRLDLADERTRDAVFGQRRNHQCEIEAQVRDVRKRVARIDGLRREHREDLILEIFLKREAFVFRQRIIRGDNDALLSQLRQQLFDKAAALLGDHRQESFPDRGELSGGRHAVGRQFRHVVLKLLFESRHADHEKLVHVARKDGEEFQTFQ